MNTKTREQERFQTFLDERNDELDNAAFCLLALLCQQYGHGDILEAGEFPWDMALIGPLLDAAEKILSGKSFGYCHPFYEDEVPCYQTKSCPYRDCVFLRPPGEQAISNEWRL